MTADPLLITTRDELTEFLRVHNESEINETALRAGVAEVLARVFGQMGRDFDPANGPSGEVVVQWDIRGPDGQVYAWQIAARPDACTVAAGTPKTPKVTLRMSLVTFLRLVTGLTSGLKALSTGKLKLKGDLMLATSIDKWFLR